MVLCFVVLEKVVVEDAEFYPFLFLLLAKIGRLMFSFNDILKYIFTAFRFHSAQSFQRMNLLL